jgi:hypothetical protein
MSYVTLLQKLRKQAIYLILFVLLGGLLIQNPNPVTHTCIPNFRTELGLSSEGYPAHEPYTQHFCKPGYYPVLRFGQDNKVTQNFAILMFVIVPALILVPLGYVFYVKRDGPDKQ